MEFQHGANIVVSLLDGDDTVSVGFLPVRVDVDMSASVLPYRVHVTTTSTNHAADESCRDQDLLGTRVRRPGERSTTR